MDKKCERCGDTEPLNFLKYSKKYCKTCGPLVTKEKAVAFHRQWVLDHPERMKDHLRKYGRKSHEKFTEIAKKIKDKPCMDCGNTYNFRAMEFDHRPGEIKKYTIGKIGWHGHAEDTYHAEVAKCDVVCSNCHRIRTWTRNQAARTREPTKTVKAMRTLQEKVNALKNKPCAICDKPFQPYQMDFDHLDPATKTNSVAELVHLRKAWSLIVAEIAKCRLVCSNCHKIHTYSQIEAAAV